MEMTYVWLASLVAIPILFGLLLKLRPKRPLEMEAPEKTLDEQMAEAIESDEAYESDDFA